MKKIPLSELVNIMGGYRTCAEVRYAANTHTPPPNPSKEEQEAEDKFWADWLKEYDRLCG